jgi:hypothetical protein
MFDDPLHPTCLATPAAAAPAGNSPGRRIYRLLTNPRGSPMTLCSLHIATTVIATAVRRLIISLLMSISPALLAAAQDDYRSRCAACHDKPIDARTPGLANLRQMNWIRVSHAVTRGPMSEHAHERDAT